jgi:hypothetical protein
MARTRVLPAIIFVITGKGLGAVHFVILSGELRLAAGSIVIAGMRNS